MRLGKGETVRPVSGFELDSQELDVAIEHPEIGGAHPDGFSRSESFERQATESGDELLAAIALIEVVHPTLADRLANELQGTASTSVGGQPVKRLSRSPVFSAHAFILRD